MELKRRTLFALLGAGAVAGHLFPELSFADDTETCRRLGPRNGGFEEQVTNGNIPGWTQDYGAGGFRVGTEQVLEGQQALHVQKSSSIVALASEPMPVNPGMYYATAARATWGSGSLELRMLFHDADGAELHRATRAFAPEASEDWYVVALGAEAPEGAATVQIMLWSPTGRAEYWIDDVSVVETHSRIEYFQTAANELGALGMTATGGKAYVVTRNQTPALLGEYEIATRSLTRKWELPESNGAWALTNDGSTVYVCGTLGGRMFKLDIESGELTAFPVFGATNLTAYNIALAEDGNLYTCTFPDCAVWQVNPDTGAATQKWTLGDGEQYARCLAAEGKYLVVGTSPDGSLYRIDIESGEVTDISPPDAPELGWVGAGIHDGVAYATTGNAVFAVEVATGTLQKSWTLEGRQIDALSALSDGSVWGTMRPEGNIYRLAPDGEEFELLGAPTPGQEHRTVQEIDGLVLGQAGNGTIWAWDGTDFDLYDVQDTEMAGPTVVQDMLRLPDGRMVVSASQMRVQELGVGVIADIPIAATPIRIGYHDGRLFTFTYPRTEVIEIDMETWETETRALIGAGQSRPWCAHYDPDLNAFLIGTEGSAGNPGALTVYRLDDDSITNHVDIIEGHAITFTCHHEGRTFIGSGLAPAGESAKIAEVDPATGEVLWSEVAVEGLRTIESMVVKDGVLVGVVRGNRWFAYDLESRTMLRRGWLAGTHSYGNLTLHGDRLILPVHNGLILELSLDGPDCPVLLDGFAEGWRRAPKLFFEGDGDTAIGLADTNLARFDLNPCHLSPDDLDPVDPGATSASVAAVTAVGRTANVWGTVPTGKATVRTQVKLPDGRWATSQTGESDENGWYVIELTYGKRTAGTYTWRVVVDHADGRREVTEEFPQTRVAVPTVATAGSKPTGSTANVWGTVAGTAGLRVWTEIRLADGRWVRSQETTTEARGWYAIELTYGKNTPGTYRWRVRAQHPEAGILTSEEFTFTRT